MLIEHTELMKICFGDCVLFNGETFFSLYIEGLRDNAKRAGGESNSPDQRNLVEARDCGIVWVDRWTNCIFQHFPGVT